MGLIKKGTIAAAFIVASMSYVPAAYAQQASASPTGSQQTSSKFSDDELKKFIEANTEVTEIQQANRQAVVAAIEEQNLTLDRFNELVKAHRQQKLEEVAANPEEISAFSEAAQSVAKLQPETKEKVKQAIEKTGLTADKYKKIMQAYENNAAVQAKIAKLVNQ
ncbi:DUF4168 domain-containing protein [Pontibacter sp. 172403-2]|uniref:DUF4168 domain-containing protein n=1 Tax=Pontibacter rufus TaxID=2791028 RepID=UPI0018AFECDB|nr:DUF4168 domain-containing protein [Pontibacter sp. 172403-2]MBF9255446.1 DUF4168 domain-containing protein [Pontibacter sp. 172403-2]